MKRLTETETIKLKREAERCARAGTSRPDISRQLGVPMHTLAKWAFEGHWRDKDIAAERDRATAVSAATTLPAV